MSLGKSAEKVEGAANQPAKSKPGPVAAAGQQLPPARPPKPADAASSNTIDVKKLSSQRLRAGAGAFFDQWPKQTNKTDNNHFNHGQASAEEAKDSLVPPGRPGISQPRPVGVVNDNLPVEAKKE